MRSATPHGLRFGRYDNMVFGPISAALPFISAGLTVLGAATTAMGQMQQGNVAAQNAQLRDQQMRSQAMQQENEAEQNRAAANNAAAVGQREAIEARRKGQIMAGRAQTVMAASGAGVDGSMTAGLLAEGDYAGDVALWQGNERARGSRNAALVNDYNAAGLRWGGAAALQQGEAARSAGMMAGIGSLVKGVAGAGMSLASTYGGDLGGASFKSVSGDITKSDAWNAMPNSWRNPGFDENWGVT